MIGIALGEFYGIGPEIVLKTYLDLGAAFPPCKIYGSHEVLKQRAKELNVAQFWNESPFDLVDSFGSTPPKGDSVARADYVLTTLNESIADAVSGKISALVTCPIDKSVIQHRLSNFSGHTEYLAEKAGVERTVMLLNNREFNIALLTNHVSLRDVSKVLTPSLVDGTIRVAARSYQQQFHVAAPKMAVLGVNPHAGELDIQSEEREILGPVIENLRGEGFNIRGPFAADSFFPKARKEKWDLIFSPFHDQGLVAAKYNGLENVVNVTLGMSFLRVSPGHGVAYDLVGKNIADHKSFKRALLVAQKHTLQV